MIQINLLPDVKQEYLRARRMRNTVVSSAIIAGIASGALVVLLLIARGVQVGLEMAADSGIKDEYSKLSAVEDLSELVTLQNQLKTIGSQHDNKSMDSRLFRVLQAINPKSPNDVQFTAVVLDPGESLLTLEGVAERGYPAVETFTKTIDNTTIEYKLSDDGELTTEAIANKVSIGETSFGQNSQGQRVLRFEVFVDYNELLFSNQAKSLRVQSPDRSVDVTDSRIGVPDSLFTSAIKEEDDDV